VVADLVEELQAGWDLHGADITNRHFANDIRVGSAGGATLQGYEQLHTICVRLKQQARGGVCRATRSSRYLPRPRTSPSHRSGESPSTCVGRPLEPASDVTGAFSEMALYVLVCRDRTWWLAAGQNTLIRPGPTGPPESQAHVDGVSAMSDGRWALLRPCCRCSVARPGRRKGGSGEVRAMSALFGGIRAPSTLGSFLRVYLGERAAAGEGESAAAARRGTSTSSTRFG